MKKFLLTACLLATSVIASAQFATSNNSKSSKSIKPNNSYNSIRLSYSSDISLKSNSSNLEGLLYDLFFDFKGLSLEYTKSANISNQLPIFLEIGIGADWINYTTSDKWDDEDGKYKEKYAVNIWKAYVPINVGYKIALDNHLSIMPYVGVRTHFCIAGNDIYTYNYDYYEENSWYKDEEGKDVDKLFDNNDLFARLLFSWQIGVNAAINEKLHIGINSEQPLGNGFNATTISVGYNF